MLPKVTRKAAWYPRQLQEVSAFAESPAIGLSTKPFLASNLKLELQVPFPPCTHIRFSNKNP